MVEKLLRQFCTENGKYKYEDGSFEKNGDVYQCLGISFAKEDSYMDAMIALTDYLERSNHYEEVLGEFTDPEVEELADRMIIYFPFSKHQLSSQ